MNEEGRIIPRRRAIRPQAVVACACWLVGISYGMSTGHSAVLLPHLRKENSTIVIYEDTESWIASVYALASPIGCFMCGVAMDVWGRRKMNILGNIGMAIGWLLIMFANNVTMLICGRIIEGFSRSVLATSITVLVDELADPKYRGFIVCSMYTFVTVGITVISSLGALLPWRIASGLAGLVCFFNLIALVFMEESPTWLLKKSMVNEAERTLQWLWGPDRNKEVEEELTGLQNRLFPKDQELEEDTVQRRDMKKVLRGYFVPHILKPFFIIHVFNIFQAFCGLGIFTFYTVNIISHTKTDGIEVLDDYITTIALFSGVFSSISALSLGAILLMRITENGSPISPDLEVKIIFTLLLVYAGSMSFGFFALPSIMIGETQAAHVRGFACGYIYSINDLLLGAVVKIYPWIINNLQIHGLFIAFGVSCVMCTLYVTLFLPETQGLTLAEIEDYFRQDNVLWVTRHRCIKKQKASVYALASPIGCFMCGVAMDVWGRRKMNILGNIGMAIGWLLIMFATNVTMLICGRILEGFSRSVLATSITVLVDELADPKYRGFIVCSINTFVTVGIMVISSLGALLPWRIASGLAGLVCLLNIITLLFMAESPTWLLKKSHVNEAERTLQWLWGPDRHKEVQEELADLQKRLQPSGHEVQDTVQRRDMKKVLRGYFVPRVLKPFFIIHVFNIFQAFCGLGIFTFYTVNIISHTKTDGIEVLDDYMTTINGSPISPDLEVKIIFTLLLVYAGSMSFGFFALPSIMIGETQVAHVRGFACGYIFSVNDLLLGAVVKMYPWMINNLQIHGLFLTFGISCVLCTLYIILFLPETQGLTLAEIEDYFRQDNILWVTRHKCIKKKKANDSQSDSEDTEL
ncbi:hypothetical protein C0J52_08666 [Blattella germanica]|nr:hypothetical protein C0J52_08666 [Blattella germanica]